MKLTAALFCLVFLNPLAVFAEEKDYILFSQTYDKEVRFVRDLTKEECEFGKNRLRGLPATKEEKAEAKKLAEEAERKEKLKCPGPFKDSAEELACIWKDTENTLSLKRGGFDYSGIINAECFRSGE